MYSQKVKEVTRNLEDKGVGKGEPMDTKGKLCNLAGLRVGEDRMIDISSLEGIKEEVMGSVEARIGNMA